MANLSLAAMHASLQFASASVIGTAIDSIFPWAERKVHTPDNIIMDAIEIVAQITLGGVVTAGVISFLDNSLDIESQDPTNAIGYLMGFVSSQPNLASKIANFQLALKGRMDQSFDAIEGGFSSQMAVSQKHTQITKTYS